MQSKSHAQFTYVTVCEGEVNWHGEVCVGGFRECC